MKKIRLAGSAKWKCEHTRERAQVLLSSTRRWSNNFVASQGSLTSVEVARQLGIYLRCLSATTKKNSSSDRLNECKQHTEKWPNSIFSFIIAFIYYNLLFSVQKLSELFDTSPKFLCFLLRGCTRWRVGGFHTSVNPDSMSGKVHPYVGAVCKKCGSKLHHVENLCNILTASKLIHFIHFLARRWGELLPLRISENHRLNIRISHPHDVLRCWNHLKEISISHEEVGRWRGCRSKALGELSCSDKYCDNYYQFVIVMIRKFFRVDLVHSKSIRKLSIVMTSATMHWRRVTLYSCDGRSTSLFPIIRFAILTVPRLPASTTSASRNQKHSWRDTTITGRQSGFSLSILSISPTTTFKCTSLDKLWRERETDIGEGLCAQHRMQSRLVELHIKLFLLRNKFFIGGVGMACEWLIGMNHRMIRSSTIQQTQNSTQKKSHTSFRLNIKVIC